VHVTYKGEVVLERLRVVFTLKAARKKFNVEEIIHVTKAGTRITGTRITVKEIAATARKGPTKPLWGALAAIIVTSATILFEAPQCVPHVVNLI
jgi:hypothetical protein